MHIRSRWKKGISDSLIFQASMNAILQMIEVRIDACNQNPGSGSCNLDREGVQGVHKVRKEEYSGQWRVCTMDLWRKLEIPLFHSDDAYAWVDRIEWFFEIWGVPEEEWVSVAVVAMEGRTLTWFRWWEETAPLKSWEVFKDAVVTLPT